MSRSDLDNQSGSAWRSEKLKDSKAFKEKNTSQVILCFSPPSVWGC